MPCHAKPNAIAVVRAKPLVRDPPISETGQTNEINDCGPLWPWQINMLLCIFEKERQRGKCFGEPPFQGRIVNEKGCSATTHARSLRRIPSVIEECWRVHLEDKKPMLTDRVLINMSELEIARSRKWEFEN
jgi:hypothetical protein